MSDYESSDAYTNLDDAMNTASDAGHVMGSWGFSSNIDFTRMNVEEANVWFFEQTFNFLRAFFGVVMPDSLEIITYNATQQINRDNLDPMTFLDELMLILKGLKENIWSLRLNLSIVGFIRDDWDPDNPVRIRIQEPCHFICWGGPDESGFQSFSISFRLFSSQEVKGKACSLWAANQPLLEKGLHKWEEQSGQVIDKVTGNSPDLSLDNSGFSSPAATTPTLSDDFFDFSTGDDETELPDWDDPLDEGEDPELIAESPEDSDEDEDDWFPDLDDLG